MASSFFRASCTIYWITWIISLSYVMGISVYESRYTLLTEDYIEATKFIKMACYLNICMAFLGCVFVKCDVSHIICFLLYTLPLLIVVPFLCIYGFLLIDKLKPLNETYTLNVVKEYMKSDKSLRPHWLERSEIDLKCCGINSWDDYFKELSPKDIKFDTGNITSKNTSSEYIPQSCCPTSTGIHCLKGEVIAICQEDVSNCYHTPPIDNKVYQKGCYQTLEKNFKSLTSAHYFFTILLIFLSLLMLLVYIKNWCATRHINKGRSDHSLDVGSISALDIPASNSAGPARKSVLDKVEVVEGSQGA